MISTTSTTRAAAAQAASSGARAPGNDAGFRADVLRSLGANDGEVAELLVYCENAFDCAAAPRPCAYPLADEPFVSAWAEYAAEVAEIGAYEALRRHLVQLRFPVARRISETAAYRAAARRGVFPDAARWGRGLELARPELVRLELHQTAAGRIPVIYAGTREDFVLLLQALARRNEPVPIPPSFGACVVSGYNNWDRVHRYRAAWELGDPARATEAAWAEEFNQLVPRKELYQDRFILLSPGPYSATAASDLGLTPAEWNETSLRIRLEHECAHYFTRRVFGSMRNALLDELLADYSGMVAATGRFRADWFLRFMGLEAFPAYRSGGRLENYRGTPPLSDGAFIVLQRLVRLAALRLEELDRTRVGPVGTLTDRAVRLTSLASLTLEMFAAPDTRVELAEPQPSRSRSRTADEIGTSTPELVLR